MNDLPVVVEDRNWHPRGLYYQRLPKHDENSEFLIDDVPRCDLSGTRGGSAAAK
jgi:hypothetical protein